MTWLRLDDGFCEHPKVDALSAESFKLHVAGLCYCARNLTDGRIPELAALRLTATARRKHVTELVESGLWRQVSDGYTIKNFLEFNPSKADVNRERELARERQRKARASRRDNSVSHAAPSRPVPSPTKEVSSISDSTRAVDNSTEDERVAAALDIVAAQRVAQVANVRSKPALTRTILANLRAEEALDVEAGRLLHDHPGLTAAQLASCLNGDTTLLLHMRKAAP